LNFPFHSPLFPYPGFLELFQQISFLHLCRCVLIFCTIFTLLHLSPSPPPSHWCQSSPPGRTCSILLLFNFVEEEREKIKRQTWHFSLFETKWVFLYICIITPIGLCTVIFFIVP
jgi:hypothetical protein